MRLAPLIISSALALLSATSLVFSGAARAAAMDPRDVTQMLARSLALDGHCNFLSTDERQDLRDLVARAEIALAGKYSVTIARTALAKGKAEGRAAPCEANAVADVRNILSAGKQAMLQQTDASPVEAPEPTKPAVAATPEPAAPKKAEVVATKPVAAVPPIPATRKQIVVEKPVATKTVVVGAKKRKPEVAQIKPRTRIATKIVASRKVSLASYSNTAEEYYVELKCRNLPLSQVQRMYDTVLSQHRAALSSDGLSAVRKLLKNARSRANAQSCG